MKLGEGGNIMIDEWNGAKRNSDGQNDSHAYIEFTRYEVDQVHLI